MRRAGLLQRTAQAIHIDRLRPRVDENDYRTNLIDMVNQARRAGVPLIFVVLGDNPLQAGFLNKGIEELHAGNADAAIDYFGIIAQSGSWFADLARAYLAKAYDARNDPEAAARIRLSSDRKESIQGGRPIRLDTTYNEIMREVARENHVRLVEAAAVIDQDPYVYIDHCHFNELGHRKVAELLAPQVADAVRTGEP
jgi:lysophospholipase L1-like esterase